VAAEAGVGVRPEQGAVRGGTFTTKRDAGSVLRWALGIIADGNATDAPGGAVRITSGGTVTIAADVSASATSGVAEGGSIDIDANTVTVQAELRVKGYGGSTLEQPGGNITVQSKGNVTVSSGAGLNAESALGAGGEVTIQAGGIVDIQRPTKVRGTGATSGMGGSVHFAGAQVKVENDITATGGHDGGTILIAAEGGGIAVGTMSSAVLDTTASNAGHAGDIDLRARGSHVMIGGYGVLRSNGSGAGASGGSIRLAGVNVSTSGGTNVTANGAAPDQGGTVEVEARGTLSLGGTIQANHEGSLTFMHRDGTPSISNLIVDYDLVQDATLTPPCGDGVRLAGTEQCDGGDFGGGDVRVARAREWVACLLGHVQLRFLRL
jgi:hypothetical protein